MALANNAKRRRIMECPVCLDWLRSPVCCCENGHGICSQCRNKVDKCPVCRGNFIGFKMTLLDEVVDMFLIRCSNNSLGCNECYPAGEIEKHEEECFFRKVRCVVCGEKNVDFSDLNNHFNNNHKNDKARSSVDFSEAVCLEIDIKNYTSALFFIIHVAWVDINFLVRYKYQKEQDILYVSVQFLGKKQAKSCRYIYSVKVDQKFQNEQCFFTVTGLCSPYSKNVNWEEAGKNERKFIGLKMKLIFLNYDYLSRSFDLEIKIKKLQT